ncbi:hypothetical protein VIN30_04405 [Adlercreutzia sp. R7]|uniref:Uncharacterized protein n=1 Tax=Adlercreutzia wanghongyangiae TaxID=3111451 RepID=A0ABU6IGW2_9ACTN|nr:hypothetical protein [Adlercreutzia sp. R7]
MKRFAVLAVTVVAVFALILCVPFQLDGKYRTSLIEMLVVRNDAAIAIVDFGPSRLRAACDRGADSSFELGAAIPVYRITGAGVEQEDSHQYPIYCGGSPIALISSNPFAVWREDGRLQYCGYMFSELSESEKSVLSATGSCAFVLIGPSSGETDSAGEVLEIEEWIVSSDLQCAPVTGAQIEGQMNQAAFMSFQSDAADHLKFSDGNIRMPIF